MKAKGTQIYKPKNHIRIVTATSLYDGHDVTINIIRRVLQTSGAEVIHLGHNRSVDEIVDCAIQEDAQAIAITCYQGGHLESFKYTYDLLKRKHASQIKIFGGGGGTILPYEIKELHNYGIDRIFSPDDGRELGLQGMINEILRKSDFSTNELIFNSDFKKLKVLSTGIIGRLISFAENKPKAYSKKFSHLLNNNDKKDIPVIGVTGTGGSGKSTLVDELIRRFLRDFPNKTLAVASIDPTMRKTNGALLGDRIRMNSISSDRVFMRSIATRNINASISESIGSVIQIYKYCGFDYIIIETSGIGQSGSEITDYCDYSIYVMTPEYGAPSQLEKIDMLDYCDIVALNKIDKSGAFDALVDVRKQYRINRGLWDCENNDMPVYGTVAFRYNDTGTNALYKKLVEKLNPVTQKNECRAYLDNVKVSQVEIIPDRRIKYLDEIAEINEEVDLDIMSQVKIAETLYQLKGTINLLKKNKNPKHNIEQQPIGNPSDKSASLNSLEKTPVFLDELNFEENIFSDSDNENLYQLGKIFHELKGKLNNDSVEVINRWNHLKKLYESQNLEYKIRDKVLNSNLSSYSISGTKIPKVALPKLISWGDKVKWSLKENVPGKFPFTAGVFPLKKRAELPTRMTAGEGGPEASNRRFHYLCNGQKVKRISTAHDSVTLYGDDPSRTPDVYGKIGSTGVSVCKVDDSKILYSGFNLSDNNTSVNLTINGPAPILLAFFFNAAIDQQCELYIREHGLLEKVQKKINSNFVSKGLPIPKYNGKLPNGSDGLGLLLLGISGDEILERSIYEKIKAKTLRSIRGTVQADILKEVQAQNTCIFSVDFALKMMGDIQEYFIENEISNFYSVSVSGYHMAEAGANPITQLSFTLANAFTYVEYYISKGMHIDEFAPNFSFFFSNGMDAEYAVLGRVARRIWARTIKHKYKGNERSQKLKYHVQTSGRSLHAQEIGFNGIRTTLQALYAFSDNCNSLHTNADDEAISIPTEKSVRKALAIQLIINKEFGILSNENLLQGSYMLEELTDSVERAVLNELKNISKRGGVIEAMDKMYQRTKIQEESLNYEQMKHSGEIPIIGVNTFLDKKGSPTTIPEKVTRLTKEERDYIIKSKEFFQKKNQDQVPKALLNLKQAVVDNGNVFSELMEACKICTLGQISEALYESGGKFRRNT